MRDLQHMHYFLFRVQTEYTTIMTIIFSTNDLITVAEIDVLFHLQNAAAHCNTRPRVLFQRRGRMLQSAAVLYNTGPCFITRGRVFHFKDAAACYKAQPRVIPRVITWGRVLQLAAAPYNTRLRLVTHLCTSLAVRPICDRKKEKNQGRNYLTGSSFLAVRYLENENKSLDSINCKTFHRFNFFNSFQGIYIFHFGR